MDTLQKNFDYIDQHFDEHIAKLQEYLRQDSISLCDGYNPRVVECAQVLCGYIRELGGFAEIIPCERGIRWSMVRCVRKTPMPRPLPFTPCMM